MNVSRVQFPEDDPTMQLAQVSPTQDRGQLPNGGGDSPKDWALFNWERRAFDYIRLCDVMTYPGGKFVHLAGETDLSLEDHQMGPIITIVTTVGIAQNLESLPGRNKGIWVKTRERRLFLSPTLDVVNIHVPRIVIAHLQLIRKDERVERLQIPKDVHRSVDPTIQLPHIIPALNHGQPSSQRELAQKPESKFAMVSKVPFTAFSPRGSLLFAPYQPVDGSITDAFILVDLVIIHTFQVYDHMQRRRTESKLKRLGNTSQCKKIALRETTRRATVTIFVGTVLSIPFGNNEGPDHGDDAAEHSRGQMRDAAPGSRCSCGGHRVFAVIKNEMMRKTTRKV